MNGRKRLVIGIIIVVIAFVIFLITLKSQDKLHPQQTEEIINLKEFELEKRAIIIQKNSLLVGENTKQLENGYYDFKLQINSNEVEISLNKLWYEEYGFDYIQDEYLAKICREIARILKYDGAKENLEYQLYKYVKDNYVKVKGGQDGEMLLFEDISIYSKSKGGECVVYIKVE